MNDEQMQSAGTSLISFGLLIFFIGLFAGMVLGNVLGATVTNGGAIQFLEQPSGSLDKKFNWLLFLITFGPALCTSILMFGLGSAFRTLGSNEPVPPAPAADTGQPY